MKLSTPAMAPYRINSMEFIVTRFQLTFGRWNTPKINVLDPRQVFAWSTCEVLPWRLGRGLRMALHCGGRRRRHILLHHMREFVR